MRTFLYASNIINAAETDKTFDTFKFTPSKDILIKKITCEVYYLDSSTALLVQDDSVLKLEISALSGGTMDINYLENTVIVGTDLNYNNSSKVLVFTKDLKDREVYIKLKAGVQNQLQPTANFKTALANNTEYYLFIDLDFEILQ